MGKFKPYIFLLFILYFSMPSLAQNYHFGKYQVEDGLSYNRVLCTIQDSYGFMWFGTENGLNRFDGAQFIAFKNNVEDSTTIGNNYISSIFEAEDKDLWVGTQNGIYIYNRLQDKFKLFQKETEYGVTISSGVAKIIKTEKGQIWIATLGQGLFIYDKESDKLTQNSTHTSFIWDLTEDKRHRIYTSSMQEGLICFDQNGNYIKSFNSQNPTKSGDQIIHSILATDNYIWYSMGTNNITRLDTHTEELKQYTDNRQNIGEVRSIVPFTEQELIIGTNYGLYTFNILKETFKRIDHPLATRSLSDLSVNNIFKDAEGGFWFGTDLGGLNYLSKQTRVLEYFHPSFNLGLGTGRIINQFCQDKNNRIWIGTQNGLKILDENGNISPFKLPGGHGDYDIRSLLLDDNYLWIGTLGFGLFRLDLNTNKIKEYKASRNSSKTIKNNDVVSLIKCTNGDIYVGTSWGLNKYVEETDEFESPTHISTMITISDMVEDDDHNLWVATQNTGVYKYRPENFTFQHYTYSANDENSVISNSIFSLHKDTNGKIWLGTNGGGLCYYDERSNSFRAHGESYNALKDRTIYSIEEDNIGRFWISTSSGLVCADIEGNSSAKLYTKENGIQSNQFILNSSLKSTSGELYFGGTNGFNSFYPDELKSNSYIPPTYITSFKIHDLGGTNGTMKELTHLTDEVKLPYNNNSFTIDYASLSYEEPSRNSYTYKLEGFDDRWINNQHLNRTSYTNLAPGSYTFKVIGTNNDGVSDGVGATLKVTIIPPWWKSNIASFIYALLFVTFVYLGLRYWSLRAHRHARREIVSFEKEKEKELYQSKINFFINLVHEIRTPLSLIKLPLDHLKEQKKDMSNNAIKYVNIIDKNVKYLLNIVNQLLDFQKTENKAPKLECQELDVNGLVAELHDKFNNYAELKNIKLVLKLPSESHIASIDQSIIDKIVFNLIDNAIRYAKSEVDIVLEYESDTFSISVIDDGQGISDDEKHKIFEPFYQVDDKINGGTGIGLAFSKLLTKTHKGKLTVENNIEGGAHFKLSLPYGQMSSVSKIAENTNNEYVSENTIGEEETFKNSTVLLVEDNEELLNLTQEALSQHFNILTAANGEEALEVLKNEQIDIVISDVMMPVMDGLELCKAIKSDINYSHVPVVLLTAKVTTEAKVEGMEYGADVYIEKPFSMRQVQMQIENLLKLRYAFQQQLKSQPTLSVVDNASISYKDQEFLEKLELEIEKHINESDFYIDSIAETMFMSRSSFYRKIKGITGVSPSEFLKSLRLNKAAAMLNEGKYNISEVYVFVGFSSSSYFAKCFKAQFGILPKDYVAEANK